MNQTDQICGNLARDGAHQTHTQVAVVINIITSFRFIEKRERAVSSANHSAPTYSVLSQAVK